MNMIEDYMEKLREIRDKRLETERSQLQEKNDRLWRWVAVLWFTFWGVLLAVSIAAVAFLLYQQ